MPRFASSLPGRAHARGGDAVVPCHVMTVSWAADHRVVEGAAIARFSNTWKALLEDPVTMLAALR